MTDQCIICNPSDDSLIVHTKRGVVLLDDPVRRGHVLVGATEHVDGIHELSGRSAGKLLKLANSAARIIVESTRAEKVYVVAIGDKDHHFHFHLVPRYAGETKLGPYVFGAAGWVETLADEPAWPGPDDSLVAALRDL